MKKKTLILYSLGSIGEGASSNTVSVYFIYFLTMIAGIQPAIAGTALMIGMICGAIANPVMGIISDQSRSKYGRRRGFIRIGCVLMFLIVMLVFWDWPGMSITVKSVYFIIVSIMFCLVYAYTDIPYLSLGGEIAKTYEERSLIRSGAYMGDNIGYLFSPVVLPLVALFSGMLGGSEVNGWRAMGIILALIIALCYFAAYYGTKGCDKVVTKMNKNQESVSNIIRRYVTILKTNKSLAILCIHTFFNCMGLGVFISLQMFVLQFYFALPVSFISIVLLLGPISGAVLSPIVGALAVKFGKRIIMIIGLCIYALGPLSILVLPTTLISAIIMTIMIFFGNTVFWSQVYSFGYDTTEVNRFHMGDTHEGVVVGLIGLCYMVSNAIGMQIAGIGLQMSGFVSEAAVQSASALAGIKNMFGWIAGGLMFISLVVFLLYPLTKQRLIKLKDANDQRDQGMSIDKEVARGL